MKKYLIALFVIFFLGYINIYGQQKVDTLNNEKIIKLTKINMAASVIVGKIKTSVCNFDVSTDALIMLNDNSVDPSVLTEMINATTKQQTKDGSFKDLKNPLTHRESGIYYFDNKDSLNPIKKIDASVIGNSKSGGGQIEGISHEKSSASLAGSHSNTQLNENMPVFYFYFDKNLNDGTNTWLVSKGESPKEFVLVKFDVSKNSRSFKTGASTGVGSVGAGSSIGIPDKDKIPLYYNKIAEGIYKVTVKQPLKGEFCFTYAAGIEKLFDFGIKETDGVKETNSNNGSDFAIGDLVSFDLNKKYYEGRIIKLSKSLATIETKNTLGMLVKYDVFYYELKKIDNTN